MEQKGFTLIEILMVIVLLSILVGLAVVSYSDFSVDAKTTVTKDKLNMIKLAIVGDGRMVSNGKYSNQGYESHCLGTPGTLTDLTTMPAAGVCSAVYDPFTKRGWRGPYLDATDPNWNKDAWGTVIDYNTLPRTLRSCGANGACGDADDISVTY